MTPRKQNYFPHNMPLTVFLCREGNTGCGALSRAKFSTGWLTARADHPAETHAGGRCKPVTCEIALPQQETQQRRRRDRSDQRDFRFVHSFHPQVGFHSRATGGRSIPPVESICFELCQCVRGFSWGEYREFREWNKLPGDQAATSPNTCSDAYFPKSLEHFGRKKLRRMSRCAPIVRCARSNSISQVNANGRATRSPPSFPKFCAGTPCATSRSFQNANRFRAGASNGCGYGRCPGLN